MRWKGLREFVRGIRGKLVSEVKIVRDEGLTVFEIFLVVDAAFGEILTTCEKLRWVIANGEECLKPQPRS